MIYRTKDIADQQQIGNAAYQDLLDRLCDDGNDEQSLTRLNYYLFEFLFLITVNVCYSKGYG
jgi:hypothetical protein